MIDYDDIDVWGSCLSEALVDVVTPFARASVASSNPTYIEDARDHLFSVADREQIIAATLEWLKANTIAAYHGTRLTDMDVASIGRVGLVPLVATARKARLSRALGRHRDWPKVEPRLDTALREYGSGNKGGRREGQVHLTLSRAGLVHGFNHYLLQGSEFDQHVAHSLLGKEGQDLLSNDGAPFVIQVELDGEQALVGAHPHFSIEDLMRMGEVPNVVREFIEAWSYRLFDATYQPSTAQTDCGIWFRDALSPDFIRAMSPCGSAE